MSDAPLDLAKEAPDPVPLPHARALIEAAGGPEKAGFWVHIDRRAMGRMYSGERPLPWAAAEYLRLKLLTRLP